MAKAGPGASQIRLPRPLTSLIGRERELAEARRWGMRPRSARNGRPAGVRRGWDRPGRGP